MSAFALEGDVSLTRTRLIFEDGKAFAWTPCSKRFRCYDDDASRPEDGSDSVPETCRCLRTSFPSSAATSMELPGPENFSLSQCIPLSSQARKT